MSDLLLVVAMAIITFSSRAIFLLRPRESPEAGYVGSFLRVFPIALFISLGTLGLAAPEGNLDMTVSLWAAAGGLVGAVVTRRSLVGILIFGGATWWIARSIF